MKIVYHCFSCNKDFVDIDQAKEHSRSLCHEVTEETQRAGKDDQLFLV
jgi:DNA-directed RNA polymerase subunit RPC12/RpoP